MRKLNYIEKICIIVLLIFSLFQVLGCSSIPPIEDIISKQDDGNTLLFIYSSYCAAIVLTDKDDIERAKNSNLSNWNTVNSLFFEVGHLDPIIIRESDSGLSVAVFSLPNNIEEVMILGFKTTLRRSGNDLDVSYIWTNPPDYIVIDHSNNGQGYIVRWNGRTTIDISQLSYNQSLNNYSRVQTYGSPREGKRIQPGFISRR